MSITDKQTFEIGDVLFDVKPDSQWINVRMHGKEGTIDKNALWAMVFAISGGKEQDDLIPVRQTEMMTFERIHTVKLNKDMRKGEILKYRAKIDVPVTIVESLKGMVETEKKNSRTIPLIGQ